jgi:spermidine synthase
MELLGFATFALATFGLGQLQSLGVLPAIARAVSAGDGVGHSILAVLLFGLPILGALPLLRQGRLFATALLGVTVAALFVSLGTGTIVLRERSFFGVVTLYGYDDPPTHLMMQGGILHGEQRLGSEDERRTARAYYHSDGPLGQILAATERLAARPQLAIIGMGAGTIAAYGSEKNAITFFELDPNVERVARDPRYFTYVDDCLKRGCELSVRIGDGRLRLQEEPRTFDLVVVDAFSSDSIPLHLLSSEAIDVYRAKLNPRGLIAFHISNQYVNLRPVLHNLSQAKGIAYASRKDDGDPTMERRSSDWVVLAPTASDLGPILTDERWGREGAANDLGVWADDYAQIANAITW